MTWPSSQIGICYCDFFHVDNFCRWFDWFEKKVHIAFLFWPAVPCHWQKLFTKEHYFFLFDRTSDFSDLHCKLISPFQYQFERLRFGTYFPPFESNGRRKKKTFSILIRSLGHIEIITENYYYFLSSLREKWRGNYVNQRNYSTFKNDSSMKNRIFFIGSIYGTNVFSIQLGTTKMIICKTIRYKCLSPTMTLRLMPTVWALSTTWHNKQSLWSAPACIECIFNCIIFYPIVFWYEDNTEPFLDSILSGVRLEYAIWKCFTKKNTDFSREKLVVRYILVGNEWQWARRMNHKIFFWNKPIGVCIALKTILSSFFLSNRSILAWNNRTYVEWILQRT